MFVVIISYPQVWGVCLFLFLFFFKAGCMIWLLERNPLLLNTIRMPYTHVLFYTYVLKREIVVCSTMLTIKYEYKAEEVVVFNITCILFVNIFYTNTCM